jgi:hypothetical protein
VTIDGEIRTKIFCQVFLAERTGIEKDPPGADEHTRKRCLQAVSDQNLGAEVQDRTLSCNDLPRAGRPSVTLGQQVEAFRQKYPFASARIIAKHFLTIGDESWFQHTIASSKMFARSAADVSSRRQQAVRRNNYDYGVLHRKESYRVRCSSER